MKTGGEVTAEYSDTPGSRRYAAMQAARSERYKWACSVDPEAVKLFEQRLKERGKK